MRRIPVYSPWIPPADADRVALAVRSGEISSSAAPVREFERAFGVRVAMPHAAAVSSGTAALELALSALGVGPGDEVVCPALTIISCARAIVLCGARPVFADVDPRSWCLDPARVADRLGPRTRAILGVHLFGEPYAHAALSEMAAKHRAFVVEDAAQAHGAVVRRGGRALPCGSLGDVSVFSFYANKAVTTGEGGMVLARDPEVIERVRNARNLFFESGRRRFLHEELGHNYRMSSLQAALGLAQLEHLDETLARKARIAALYEERLSGIPELELQARSKPEDAPPWMIAAVLTDGVDMDADELRARLDARGIETRPFFAGLHEQPALLGWGLTGGERYPVTERLSRRGFYLPSGLDLDEETIDGVVREVREALSRAPRGRREPASANDEPGSPSSEVFGPEYAEAYDAFYAAKDYVREAAVLSDCFARLSRVKVKRVLDLGCGSGRHVEALAKSGFDVVGVDRSAPMLDLARKRVPGVRFERGDMRELDLGETFDAVVILFAALGYQTTPRDILAALRSARRHVRDGGLLVADVWLGASGAPSGAPTRRVARCGPIEWIRTGFLTRDPVAQRVDISYELEKSVGAQKTVTREVHRMHYFSPFELEFALASAGFRLALLCREGDLDHAPAASDLTALFVAEAIPAGATT